MIEFDNAKFWYLVYGSKQHEFWFFFDIWRHFILVKPLSLTTKRVVQRILNFYWIGWGHQCRPWREAVLEWILVVHKPQEQGLTFQPLFAWPGTRKITFSELYIQLTVCEPIAWRFYHKHIKCLYEAAYSTVSHSLSEAYQARLHSQLH